jgi:hypothetical protein
MLAEEKVVKPVHVTMERNLCYIQAATLGQKINSRLCLDPVVRSYDIWQRCSFTPPYGFFGASSCSMAVIICIVRLLRRFFFFIVILKLGLNMFIPYLMFNHVIQIVFLTRRITPVIYINLCTHLLMFYH